MTRRITIVLLIALAVALIGWDIYAQATVPDSSATISRVVLAWAQQHPALPFALGFLMGHLLWPQPNQRTKEQP
jgi:hypothetical protein